MSKTSKMSKTNKMSKFDPRMVPGLFWYLGRTQKQNAGYEPWQALAASCGDRDGKGLVSHGRQEVRRRGHCRRPLPAESAVSKTCLLPFCMRNISSMQSVEPAN